MSVQKLTSSVSTPSTYDVEYRAIPDDAWYSVRTVLEGEKLRVKYENFSDEQDNIFEPQNFQSIQEIEAFEKRFRPLSNQLQDQDCRKLSVGTVVCASHSFTSLDNRFYDAVVDAVIHREHSVGKGGEEQCMCTFVVVWKHGPIVGCLANKKVENVCVVQSNAKLDPKVAKFSKIVRLKLQSQTPTKTNNKLCHSRSLSNSSTSEEMIFEGSPRIKEDIDVGGIGNQYTVLIDNLDKDLNSSTIVDFLHRLTSVSVQAYVFPSLSFETYTNGAVVVDCEKSFHKLCDFLDSSDHIIMSRRGRPWVITAKLSGHDSYLGPLGNLMPKFQASFFKDKLDYRYDGIGNDLKVVCSGSEEYKKAEQLRDLFVEFSEHQERLHKKLALEERKILQASLVMQLQVK